MTIREAQELVRFADEKHGSEKPPSAVCADELHGRFVELLRLANRSGVDLTGALVEPPKNIKDHK